MDIYEYAMKMEEDGRQFYLELAEKSADSGIKSILKMLADDEKKHYETIEKIRDKEYAMPETPILNDAKNVFEKMGSGSMDQDFTDSEVELYKKALEIEEESVNFYQEKSEQMEHPGQREVMARLADEEKRHYHLINNMIEFMQRPHTWLEDAEWNHLDQY